VRRSSIRNCSNKSI